MNRRIDFPLIKKPADVDNPEHYQHLPDIQSNKDLRGIPLNRVGVGGIHFPLTIKQRGGGTQLVNATIEMFGSLLHRLKGTNMSRFSEVLMEWHHKPLSGTNFKELLKQLKKRLKSDDVYIGAAFPYFVTKAAPISGKVSVMSYDCKFIGKLTKAKYDYFLQVTVPVNLTCPCSRELTLVNNKEGIGKGAHNQRAEITAQVKVNVVPGPWFETIIKMLESCGSCDLFSLLKRPDEKYVTEKGYMNARFVEDAAREAAVKLQRLRNVTWIKVKVQSHESIHDHSAFAYVARTKKGNTWRKSDEKFY